MLNAFPIESWVSSMPLFGGFLGKGTRLHGKRVQY